jgi:hypothetical protein
MLVWDPEYAANKLRQDLWRAAHAHAGVLLVLNLVMLPYVDEARLSPGMKGVRPLGGADRGDPCLPHTSFRCWVPTRRNRTR